MSQTIGAAAPRFLQVPSMSEAVQDALAAEAVSMVQPGMTVGIGSGTTASRALRFLADRVKHEQIDVPVFTIPGSTPREICAAAIKAAKAAEAA